MMGLRGPLPVLVMAAALPILVIATGCGGGSSSTASGGSSAAETTSASSGESRPESGDGEAAKEFAVPGKKSEVVEFGKEASDSEREAASVILEENLEARASHRWAAQCVTLSAKGIKSIESNPANKGQTCAQVLAAEGSSVPEGLLANTLEGEIDALRVGGAQAFALWHGAAGGDYSMAMENEDGQWKVASLTTARLPKAGSESKSPSSN